MPDMRKKIEEYLLELDSEIIRCEKMCDDYAKSNNENGSIVFISRIQALIEVRNDLRSRLDEIVD